MWPPTWCPPTTRCAGVEDVFNAISVTGNAIGDVMFYGRGAGKLPTASAVVADVIDIAKDLKTARCAVWGPGSRDLVVSSDILSSRWYVRGTASMDKVRAAFGEISPLARGGAPAGETAFLDRTHDGAPSPGQAGGDGAPLPYPGAGVRNAAGIEWCAESCALIEN